MAWEKGVAQAVSVTFYKSGVPTAPTGALTATINKDGGGFGAIGGTCVQTGTTPTALLTLNTADTNCDTGVVKITDAGGAVDDRYIEFVTEAGYTAARAAYLDAAITSRSTYAGGAVASVSGNVVGNVEGNVEGNVTGKVIGDNPSGFLGTGAAVVLTNAGVTAAQAGLATAANQTTILACLGSWTGTGVNTVLGAIKALALTAASAVSDLGGTFDSATDSLQAIRDRGDAGWTPAGTGARVVTVTVSDDDGDPVADASVTLTNTAGTATLAGPLTTNTSGQCVFNRDDAETGKAVVRSTALIGAGSTAYTVSGATAVAVTVALATIPAATSPDNYVLHNTERKVEADAAFGAAAMTVTVVEVDREAQNDATANASRAIQGTPYNTDASGAWSIEIAKVLNGHRLTIEKAWTGTEGSGTIARTERWQATIDSTKVHDTDQLCWADLTPRKV